MGVVAGRRIGEEDAAVGRDVAIVGIAQPGVVDDRSPRPAGLGRQLGHRAVAGDRVQAHGADAGLERAVAIEGEAEGKAADVGEDL